LQWFLLSKKVSALMCEASVTNAEPSEDNSISAVRVAQLTIAKGGLERM